MKNFLWKYYWLSWFQSYQLSHTHIYEFTLLLKNLLTYCLIRLKEGITLTILLTDPTFVFTGWRLLNCIIHYDQSIVKNLPLETGHQVVKLAKPGDKPFPVPVPQGEGDNHENLGSKFGEQSWAMTQAHIILSPLKVLSLPMSTVYVQLNPRNNEQVWFSHQCRFLALPYLW